MIFFISQSEIIPDFLFIELRKCTLELSIPQSSPSLESLKTCHCISLSVSWSSCSIYSSMKRIIILAWIRVKAGV